MKKYLHYLIATLVQVLMCSFTLGFTTVPKSTQIHTASNAETGEHLDSGQFSNMSSERKTKRAARRCCSITQVSVINKEEASGSIESVGSVSGIVLDATGGPVPNSNVALFENNKIITGTMAGARGQFGIYHCVTSTKSVLLKG